MINGAAEAALFGCLLLSLLLLLLQILKTNGKHEHTLRHRKWEGKTYIYIYVYMEYSFCS